MLLGGALSASVLLFVGGVGVGDDLEEEEIEEEDIWDDGRMWLVVSASGRRWQVEVGDGGQGESLPLESLLFFFRFFLLVE